jgi:hypothetical protein
MHKTKEVDPRLREYEEEEMEAVIRTIKKIPDIPVYARHLTGVIRMFYEDKFQFKEPISFNEFPPHVPAKWLLPFNEQIVLPISFLEKNRKDFVRVHGLSPEEIAHLYSRKRVLPILMQHPARLTKEQRDCMEALLEKKPPTIIRIEGFLNFSSNLKFNDYYKQGSQIAKKAKATIRKRVRNAPFSVPERIRKELEATADVSVIPYTHLHCLGLGDLVDDIFAKYSDLAILILNIYSEVLVDPYVLGLGAMPQLPTHTAARSRCLLYHLKELPKIIFSQDLVFPVEVGELLTKYYNLTFPLDPSLDIVDKAYRDKTLDKARRLLAEFDKAVREMDAKRAIEEGKGLEEVFKKAIEAILVLDKRLEKCKWGINSFAYGAIGLLGIAVHPVAGILAGMGYRVAEKKVTEAVTPKLAGIGFNPLSVAMWEFKREFKNIEELITALKKIKTNSNGSVA